MLQRSNQIWSSNGGRSSQSFGEFTPKSHSSLWYQTWKYLFQSLPQQICVHRLWFIWGHSIENWRNENAEFSRFSRILQWINEGVFNVISWISWSLLQRPSLPKLSIKGSKVNWSWIALGVESATNGLLF